MTLAIFPSDMTAAAGSPESVGAIWTSPAPSSALTDVVRLDAVRRLATPVFTDATLVDVVGGSGAAIVGAAVVERPEAWSPDA